MSMKLPERFPGTKWITVLWALYVVAWSAFEGELWTTVVAAILTWLVMVMHVLDKPLAGRTFSNRSWLALWAGLGLTSGFATAFLTLLFMAIKTGLHAHGPEYSTAELEWALQKLPLWSLAGFLAGLGAGFISLSGFASGD